jgi:ribosomal protein S18 acetylase RimI-like enzyme
MTSANIELLNIEDNESVQEYSDLIMDVMYEFNKEEVDDFQNWFASVEGIVTRRTYGYESLRTVQFVARFNGSIIGVLEVETMNHIQSFFVKKEFHNKGIGRQLINYSLNFFKKNGIEVKRYSVYSSDYAIDIYKKMGFIGEDKFLTLKIEDMKEQIQWRKAS